MVLEGRTLKEQILNSVADEVKKLTIKPTLVVIQVGDDSASNVYVSQKEKMCNEVGFNFIKEKLTSNIKEEELIKIIEKYNNDQKVSGILVQLPLPKHIDKTKVFDTIDYKKDVDGLNSVNVGRLANNLTCLIPCTAYGIMELFKYYNISLEKKDVVIIGRSQLVGKPLVSLLLNNNATVTICHSKTVNLKKYTKNADIIISATGKKHLITKDMVRENATVIDVGITRENSKLYGDVSPEVQELANVTPVPGGVGQLTVASLAKNILLAYYLK